MYDVSRYTNHINQQEYISVSQRCQGPTAVACWWCIPCLAMQRHNPELWCRERKPSKSSCPRHLSRQFQSPCHKIEAVQTLAFLSAPEMHNLHSQECFSSLSIFPVIPRLRGNLPNGHSVWWMVVSKVWRSKPFRYYFPVILHMARSIGLGETSQADCSTAETN